MTMFYNRKIIESTDEPNDTNVLWLYLNPTTGIYELRVFSGTGWVAIGTNTQTGG